MLHHTKDKGDRGLGFVISDLLQSGVQPAILLSEHLPFDCIAIAPDGRLSRLSVKYRAAKDGAITVSMISSWADRHGTHSRRPDFAAFDAVAVYCPDTALVYYVRCDELKTPRFLLRLDKPKNGQSVGVRYAALYCGALRLFEPESQT